MTLTKKNSTKAQRRALEAEQLLRKVEGGKKAATTRSRKNRPNTRNRLHPSVLRGLADWYSDRAPFRFPGGGSFPSVGYVSKTRALLAACTGGTHPAPTTNAAMRIRLGQLTDLFQHGTTIDAAGDITGYGSWISVPELTSISNSFAQYRVTQVHVKFLYVGSSLNNEGRLMIKLEDTDSAAGSETNNFYDRAPVEKEFPIKMGASVVPGPKNEIAAASLNLIADKNDGWPVCNVYSVGQMAGNAVIEVIITQKLELIPKSSDFASRIAEPAEPMNNDLVQHGREVTAHLQRSGQTVLPGSLSMVQHTDDALKTVGAGAVGYAIGSGRWPSDWRPPPFARGVADSTSTTSALATGWEALQVMSRV